MSLQKGNKTDADRDGWMRQGPNSHQLTLNFCHENFRASVVTLCFLWWSLHWEKRQQSDTPRLRTTLPSAVMTKGQPLPHIYFRSEETLFFFQMHDCPDSFTLHREKSVSWASRRRVPARNPGSLERSRVCRHPHSSKSVGIKKRSEIGKEV